MLRRLLNAPGFRFLLAGGFAAAVNWVVRFPFSTVMPFAAAVVAAQGLSLGVGFVLYRSFVFAPSGRSAWREFPAFALVNAASLIGVLAVTLALDCALEAIGLDGAVAEATAHATGIAAGAVVNFLGHRAFTFATRAGPGVATAPRRS